MELDVGDGKSSTIGKANVRFWVGLLDKRKEHLDWNCSFQLWHDCALSKLHVRTMCSFFGLRQANLGEKSSLIHASRSTWSWSTAETPINSFFCDLGSRGLCRWHVLVLKEPGLLRVCQTFTQLSDLTNEHVKHAKQSSKACISEIMASAKNLA